MILYVVNISNIMYRKLKEAVPGAVYSSEGSSSSPELDRRVREVTRQKEEEAARSEARIKREWEERLSKEKQAVKEALGEERIWNSASIGEYRVTHQVGSDLLLYIVLTVAFYNGGHIWPYRPDGSPCTYKN